MNKDASASDRLSLKLLSFARKNLNEISLLIGLFVVGAVFSSQSEAFFTSANLINILRSAALLGIVTWGMTLVIIAGEIDVSVGPAVAFSSVMVGWFTTRIGIPLPISIVLVIITTTLVSFGGGYIRAHFNVPSFVTTLALWSIYDGFKQVLSNNIPIPVRSESFGILANGELWGIPYPIIFAFVMFLGFEYLAKNTVYGRSIYSVGGNAKAAYASGINVKWIRASVFAITGFLSALTGILHVSRLGTSTGQVAAGLEFSAIAAVVIGGTSLSGGRGKMIGSLIGVVFITLIGNGLVLIGVNSQAQNVVRGILILAAVLMNVVFKKESKDI
jgi:simple sugar transport system permease protein